MSTINEPSSPLTHKIALALIALAIAFYLVAFMAFQWRNPKANSMSFFRDFVSIIAFQRIQEYQ